MQVRLNFISNTSCRNFIVDILIFYMTLLRKTPDFIHSGLEAKSNVMYTMPRPLETL